MSADVIAPAMVKGATTLHLNKMPCDAHDAIYDSDHRCLSHVVKSPFVKIVKHTLVLLSAQSVCRQTADESLINLRMILCGVGTVSH